MTTYLAGQNAALNGIARNANPHIVGTTKLGNPKFDDDGQWDAGWISAQAARVASTEEIAAARTVDVSRFRRRSNRYYTS